MPHFVIVAHKTPPDGDWGLDDLAGDGGRVDVLCRAVSSALFVSHGIRSDTAVTLVFTSDPDRPTAVRIDGLRIQHLNPDERSTAARIRAALRARHDDPWWDEVEPGLSVAPLGLQEVLDELQLPSVWLDRDGQDAHHEELPQDACYILSDHVPFSEAEEHAVAEHAILRLSVGGTWYHGHHVVGILQYLLDRRRE